MNHSSTSDGFQDLDLDNALESLLEDNSGKRGGGRQKAKATKTRGKDSTSKYVNQFAEPTCSYTLYLLIHYNLLIIIGH